MRRHSVIAQSCKSPRRRWARACACLSVAVAALAGAQGPEAQKNLFTTMRPDIMIVVSKHPMGTDTVTVTPFDAAYTEELLRKQIQELGKLLGSEPRGLTAETTNPIPGNASTSAVRMSFGIAGLVKREESRLGLEALAKAFAQNPKEGKANALLIQFESEEPTDKIWKNYANDGLQLQGQADPRFGIEYRIKLLTTDPAKIVIPEGPDAQKAKVPPAPKPAEVGTNWTLIGIVVVAALAVGALVYSLLLRPRPTRS